MPAQETQLKKHMQTGTVDFLYQQHDELAKYIPFALRHCPTSNVSNSCQIAPADQGWRPVSQADLLNMGVDTWALSSAEYGWRVSCIVGPIQEAILGHQATYPQ